MVIRKLQYADSAVYAAGYNKQHHPSGVPEFALTYRRITLKTGDARRMAKFNLLLDNFVTDNPDKREIKIMRHGKNCYCQNCRSHSRTTFWLWIAIVIITGILLFQSKSRAEERKALTVAQLKVDIDFREGLQSLKKKCPSCATYISVGDMANAQGQPVPCGFVFIKDQGTNFRVSRIQTRAGIDIVTVMFPGGIVDAGLLKFIKGGLNE